MQHTKKTLIASCGVESKANEGFNVLKVLRLLWYKDNTKMIHKCKENA